MHPNYLEGKKRLHFIGIGGSGMFPLVQILHKKGYSITGSDNNESDILKMVRALGITVFMGQRAENIKDAELVIYSAAIQKDNPELAEAINRNIPTIERSAMLGLFTQWFSTCICVAGTHGKTTASSMLTELLKGAELDPSYVIGGKLKSTGNYGFYGNPDLMVCEACEFVDTFLKLSPSVSVILNIDRDHMDYFKTMENLKNSFVSFCKNARDFVLYNGDDPNACEVVERANPARCVSFGFSSSNKYYPKNIKTEGGAQTSFDLYSGDEFITNLTIHVPGRHNILNAVSAAAAALEIGVEKTKLAKGLANFEGAGRRFEILGKKNGFTVADDYAHHPTEIAATLKAAKELGYRQIWALHQPFTYSRTQLLLDEFAEALSIADRVVLTEIMGGREKDPHTVYAKDLAKKIDRCVWFETQKQAAEYILDNAEPEDLVITMGCGDIYKAAHIILDGSY